MILLRNWKGLEDDGMKTTQRTQISNLQMIMNSCKDPLLVMKKKSLQFASPHNKKKRKELAESQIQNRYMPTGTREGQVMASFSSIAKFRTLWHSCCVPMGATAGSSITLDVELQRQMKMHFASFAKRNFAPQCKPQMFSSQLILSCWQLQSNQLPELCQLLRPAHKSSVYHETAAGAGVKIVSCLVAEDHQVGQARLAKAILIFPGCILAFHVVGSVHSIHFSYWWQKPSGYYGVALKQSG